MAPATFRQHMMMVGTARTAVRSPQVQYTEGTALFCCARIEAASCGAFFFFLFFWVHGWVSSVTAAAALRR